MPNTPLCLCFTYNAEPFLHLRVDQIDHFDSNELCHAANWIIQQLRARVPEISKIRYLFTSSQDYLPYNLAKETVLTTNGVYSILHECQIFNHHEISFSVAEEPGQLKTPPVLFYKRQPAEDDFGSLRLKINKLHGAEEHLFDATDVTFTDFLKKLESRQQDIMKRLHNVSFSSEEPMFSDGDQSLPRLIRETSPEDIFQPHLPSPDHEVFFDSSDRFEREPLLAQNNPWRSSSPEPHKEENTLDKLIAELLGRVDTMCVKETKNRRFVDSDDSLDETEKKISDISMEISAFEKECHMQNVEKNCVLPKAKLSMTVATSTDVRGKAEQTQAETQTDKESGSDDEIAIIRHALAVIQKKKKRMSTIGKKSPELKRKKIRSSRSPKCSCCRKEKSQEKGDSEKKKERKEEAPKREKKKEKKAKKMEKVENWILGSPFPNEWNEPSEKKKFNLEAALEKLQTEEADTPHPSSSEMDEPFNRKLREKWAHDGMKSLKKNVPIQSIRLPHNKVPSRFYRFQSVDSKADHGKNGKLSDEYCDKYSLARLDGKIYKLVPRYSGISTPLNKNYIGQTTVPANLAMAIMDESDPWINWDNHYVKVFRALNLGSKTVKGLRLEELYSNNMEIARNLSKVPESVPMDFVVDFEIAFNLIEKDREGICVMQLKDEEGAIVSPTFAFIGKKIDRAVSPQRHSSVLKELMPSRCFFDRYSEYESLGHLPAHPPPPPPPQFAAPVVIDLTQDSSDEDEEVVQKKVEIKKEEEDEEEYEKVESQEKKVADEESDFELVDDEDK